MSEFSHLCRICLLPESPQRGNMFPLLATKIHMNSIALLEVIGLFTDMRLVTEDLRFPQRICSSCVNDLTLGYTFKLKCEQSEIYLRKKILQNTDINILSERKQINTSTKYLKRPYSKGTSKIDSKTATKKKRIEDTDTCIEEVTEFAEPEGCYEIASDSTATINGNQVKLEHLFDGNISENISAIGQKNNKFNPEPSTYSMSLNTKSDGRKPFFGNVIIKKEKIGESEMIATENEAYTISYTGECDFADVKTNSIVIKDGSNDPNEHLHFDDIIEFSDYEILKNENMSPPQAPEIEEVVAESDDWSQEAEDAENMFLANIKQKHPQRTREKSNSNKNEQAETASITCSVCDKDCASIDEMKNHFVSEHCQDQYCTVCKKDFVTPISLHAVSHIKSEKVFECEKCSKKFVSDHFLMLHSILKHSQCACPTCGEELNNEADYEEHVSMHTSEDFEASASEINSFDFRAKRYCQHCNEFFDKAWELRNHFTSHHINGSYCDVCKKDIQTSKFKHVTFHTNPGKYRCDSCALNFLREHVLKVHMTTVHNDHSICEFCLKEFDSEEDLKSHKYEHEMNGTLGHYICPKCGKVCVSVAGLTKHYDIHLDPAYKCENCSHTFHILSDYKKHLALDHQVKCTPTCHYCKIVN